MVHCRTVAAPRLKTFDGVGNGARELRVHDANDVAFVHDGSASARLFKNQSSVRHGILTLPRAFDYLLVNLRTASASSRHRSANETRNESCDVATMSNHEVLKTLGITGVSRVLDT